jgi:hypothetical protein
MSNEKRIYFLAGLPRSGSTLLANILAQLHLDSAQANLTGGTTIDNLFRDNVYRVASLTDPSFAWWDGSEMREVDWMTWTSVYGQDLRGTASTMP